jgi:signal transduction histidine kinase/integral membrane sensor domain MASE1
MASEQTAQPTTTSIRVSIPETPFVLPAAAAIAVCLLYVAGMQVGSALTAAGSPISTLWPPNALLMAALLISPRRLWPLYIGLLLPVHLLFQHHLGLPLPASLGWFVGNTGEAVLGAALLRRSKGEEPLFNTVRGAIRFVLLGALFAPALTSFWDAAVVVSTGMGSNYWRQLSIRLLSDTVAILLFVPPIVTSFEAGFTRWRRSSSRRRVEAAALAATALMLCLGLDLLPRTPLAVLLGLLALLPVFLWAALRFGPLGSSVTVLAVTLGEIWILVHAGGPFAGGTVAENVLSFQISASLIAIPLLLLAVTVGERRRAEHRLRHNEERLELAFAVSRMASWELDLRSGDLTYSEDRLGFEEMCREPDLPRLFGAVHPEDSARVRSIHEVAVQNKSSYEVECRVFDREGIRWIHRKGQVVADRAGNPVKVFGVDQDITDRKKNEEALAEAEKIGRLARSAGRIAIWSMDVETGKIYTESSLSSLLGFDVGSDRGTFEVWLDRIYEPDRLAILAILEYIGKPGAPTDERGDIPIPELEYRMHHADGTLRWFLTRGTVVRSAAGSPRRIVGTAIDVTERKTADLEAQEQRRELTHLARVSALGELSGSLAHELNQPLTSILSNAQAARRLLDRDSADLPEVRRILDDIVSDDRRAGEVIRHLRGLLRKGSGQVQNVDVSALVQDTLRLLQGDLVTRNVTVVKSLESGLPPVAAEPVQLQQVLLNLVLNACESMSANPPEDRNIVLSTFQKGSTVVVAVADNGPGIRPEHMETLFRPFFTTKSEGLGLGLSICQSIIRGCGGRLWAENNKKGGARFQFSLPVASVQKPRETGFSS